MNQIVQGCLLPMKMTDLCWIQKWSYVRRVLCYQCGEMETPCIRRATHQSNDAQNTAQLYVKANGDVRTGMLFPLY